MQILTAAFALLLFIQTCHAAASKDLKKLETHIDENSSLVGFKEYLPLLKQVLSHDEKYRKCNGKNGLIEYMDCLEKENVPKEDVKSMKLVLENDIKRRQFINFVRELARNSDADIKSSMTIANELDFGNIKSNTNDAISAMTTSMAVGLSFAAMVAYLIA